MDNEEFNILYSELKQEFGAVVAVSEISERFFNLSYKNACELVRKKQFPLDTFRLRPSSKAPLLTKTEYLTRLLIEHINKRPPN